MVTINKKIRELCNLGATQIISYRGLLVKGFLSRVQRVDSDASRSEVYKESLSNVAVKEAERIIGIGEGRSRGAGDQRSVSGCC
jgi:hypothetical protein